MINTTKAGMILFMVSALCSYLDKSWSRVVLVINFTTLLYGLRQKYQSFCWHDRFVIKAQFPFWGLPAWELEILLFYLNNMLADRGSAVANLDRLQSKNLRC